MGEKGGKEKATQIQETREIPEISETEKLARKFGETGKMARQREDIEKAEKERSKKGENVREKLRKFEEENRRTKREEKQNSRRGVESNWTDRDAQGGHIGLESGARRGVRDDVGGAGGPQQKIAEYDQNSSRGILNDQLYSWTHGGQDGQGGDAVSGARDGGNMVEYDRN